MSDKVERESEKELELFNKFKSEYLSKFSIKDRKTLIGYTRTIDYFYATTYEFHKANETNDKLLLDLQQRKDNSVETLQTESPSPSFPSSTSAENPSSPVSSTAVIHDVNGDEENVVKFPSDEDTKREDWFLLRYLRAQKHVVTEAMNMLTTTVEFKKSFQGVGVDRITIDTCLNEVATRKAVSHGHDTSGRPCFYLQSKRHFKKDPLETERFAVWFMETWLKKVEPGTVICAICNLKGISFANMDMASTKFMIDVYQNHFPEILGVCLVLNPSLVFWGLYKLIRPFLDPVVASKIVFISDRKTLSKYISEDQQLPDLIDD